MPTPLRIALFAGNSLLSKGIQWQTRSHWSHAALILRTGALIEAREFIGVRQLPQLHVMPGERVNLFDVDVTDSQASMVEGFAIRQLSKKYDWTMVLRFLSRRQANRESAGKWFCSELVFAAFAHAGIELLRDTEPWEVSPGLLGRSPLLRPVAVEHFPALARAA